MAQTINYQKVKSDTGAPTISVGTILPWSKTTAPTGFLKCDGSAVSRDTYNQLFQVIGTTYGSGDGSTTFNLPDLTSRSVVGANTSTNVGQTGGAHDTDGAGFTLQNNLSTGTFNNLSAQTTDNSSVGVTSNLGLNNAQNLSTLTTQNLSVQTAQNLGVSDSQNLSGSVSGNISTTTLSLAQITSHNHPGRQAAPPSFSSTVRFFPNGPETARLMGSFGNAGSSQAHNHGHNFTGVVNGNVTSSLSGNVTGAISGDVSTNITGTADGSLTGNVAVNKTGSLNTNLTGEVTANISGNVDAQNASLFSPHTVIIYIIKT